MKKLICVLLALAMCLGLGTSALADGGVELPDAAQFLSEWLEDYGVTVELVKQDDLGTTIGIENVQDMQTVLDETRFGMGRLLRLNGFDLTSGPDTAAGELLGEYLYTYTGGASVGTVEDSTGAKGNVYVHLYDDGDLVNGITVEIVMGDGISMKSSDADTAAGTDALDTGADNILPDAWAFFNKEIRHRDKVIENGKQSDLCIGCSRMDNEELFAAIEQYAELLQSGRFGLTLKESDYSSSKYGTSAYYTFDYAGTGEESEVGASVDYEYRTADVILELEFMLTQYDVHIYFSNALTVADTGDRCTETRLRNFSSYYDTDEFIVGPMGCGAILLPDAWAFFHEEMTHSDDVIDNGKDTFFEFDPEREQLAAAYEYPELLSDERFGFTLTDRWAEQLGDGLTEFFLFDHPDVKKNKLVTLERQGGDISAAVILCIQDYTSDGWCDIYIMFSDALTVMDTGDRCTFTGFTDRLGLEYGVPGAMGCGASSSGNTSTGGGGGSVSGGSEDNSSSSTVESSSSSGTSSSGSSVFDDDDDYSPFTHETKCYKCHGDGEVECSQCDGDGGKWVYDSVPNYSGHSDTTVRTWESCFKCHGSGEMTCPACGGSGKG